MKKLLLCLLSGVMSLTSCESSDPVGLADPMKWSTVPSGLKNGELKVEAEGGSCLFACKNYKSFWIASVKEEGKHFIQGVLRRLVSRQDRGQRTKGYHQSQRNERITFLHGLRGSRKRLRRIQVRTRCCKTIILQYIL